LIEECYPKLIFKLKVNIKAVPYSLILYRIQNLGVHPRPCSQTSAARYRAAAHSLSSIVLLNLKQKGFAGQQKK